MTTWRELCRPPIAAALDRAEDLGVPVAHPARGALRRLLVDAYPFGERRHWPYRVWLSEVRRSVRARAGLAPGPCAVGASRSSVRADHPNQTTIEDHVEQSA